MFVERESEAQVTQIPCRTKYRITTVLKVETDIIASIVNESSRTSCYPSDNVCQIFKSDVIVFISIKRHNMTSH